MRFNANRVLKVAGRSWLLSRDLLHPPEHPLYLRIVRQRGAASILIWVGLLIGIFSCCALSMMMVNVRASVNALFFTVLFTLSTGVALGWSASIAAALIHERESATYEILCVTPDGAQPVDWAVCAGKMHRDDSLLWTHEIRFLFLIVLSTAFIIVLASTLAGTRPAQPAEQAALLLTLVVVGVTTYFDEVQTVVLCGLVGMSVPYHANAALDGRLWAAGGFLLVQVLTFMAAVFVDRVLTVMVSSTIGLLAGAAVIYLCREVMIAALWHGLKRQWNSE